MKKINDLQIKLFKINKIFKKIYFIIVRLAVAQLVEQWTVNPFVAGSSPAGYF